MVDRLAGVGAAVDHHAIAAGQFQFTRQTARNQQQMSGQQCIVIGQIGERRNLSFRDH